MVTCDSQKHLVALAAKKLGDIMQEQDGSMKNDVAATTDDQKGLSYYWNLTTVYPKKLKRSASSSTRWKSYSFKRLKSDGSSSSSSSTAETEQTNNSRDDMEIHRGFYT
jgi:cytolysin (calcineurin-like family phosphatase)